MPFPDTSHAQESRQRGFAHPRMLRHLIRHALENLKGPASRAGGL